MEKYQYSDCSGRHTVHVSYNRAPDHAAIEDLEQMAPLAQVAIVPLHDEGGIGLAGIVAEASSVVAGGPIGDGHLFSAIKAGGQTVGRTFPA